MTKGEQNQGNPLFTKKQATHHDIFFKQAYSDPQFARELFQLVFSKNEWSVFDWNKLKSEKDTFLDQRADLIFSVPLKKNLNIQFKICLLLEHKSQYSRRLFYQLLKYQTLIVGKAFQEAGQTWPVIPVVFYHGKQSWNWKTSFQEGFFEKSFSKIPVSVQRSMLNYRLRLLDTHDPKVEKVLKNKNFKSRGFLNTLKKIWFLKADEALLGEAISLFDNWSGDRDDLMLNLGNYLWAAIPGMTKELWEAMERKAIKKGLFSRGGYMNIREYIKEEGVQEGIQKGRQEERQQVALNMLQEKTEIPFIAKVTGLSEEEIKKLKKLKNSS